jgi:hypothetical protein
MSKQAVIKSSVIDSRTKRIEIRSGAKGTGKQLWSCQYWPDSSRSVENMEEYLSNEIERIEADGYIISDQS